MADDTKKAVGQIREGVKGVARASPAVAYGEALAKLGEKVIEHTPEPIKRYGRRLRSEFRQLTGRAGQRRRVRRHQRSRARSRSSRR